MKIKWNEYLYQQINKPLFQALDKKGRIINPHLIPHLSTKKLINAYELMQLSRTFQTLSNNYAKENKLINFLISTGQEAIQVAMGLILKPKIDWYLSGYRDNAVWITLNKPIATICQYWIGYELGNTTPKENKIFPLNVLTGTQFSQAVGIALANKLQKNESIVIVSTGEGGTSEGEVNAAMNMAAVMGLKIIFVIQNNQWALSTPLQHETICTNLAQKGPSVGITSLKIDGNDFLASYTALQYARKYVTTKHQPFFIEAITYRMGPHDMNDKPELYRNEALHQKLCQNDPLIRFKKYLINKKIWNENLEQKLQEKNKTIITTGFDKAFATPAPQLKDIYQYTYATMPEKLLEQYETWKLRFAKGDPSNEQ